MFLVTDPLWKLLKVFTAVGILGAIALILWIVGLFIGSALGIVDLDAVEKKSEHSTKADQTSPNSNSEKTTNTSPKSGQDSSHSTDFVDVLDRKRRLEVEIEILEGVLRARREELAQFN